MEKLVSIIIPVYNSERYLKYCLDSVVGQTYKNTEIILIDDESTDSSGKICDKYAKQYQNIKVVHQKNKGCGFSRNTGLEIMQGSYYTFIDADDYVSSRYIEVLVDVLEKYDADIATSGTIFMLETRNEKKRDDGSIDVFEITDCDKIIDNYVSAPSWGKMYRTETLGHIRYDRASYEDVPYAAMIKPLVKKAVNYNNALYVYRAYQDSITRGNFGKKTLKKLHDQYSKELLTEKNSAIAWLKSVKEALSTVRYRNQEILYKKYISLLLFDIDKLQSISSKELVEINQQCAQIKKAIVCNKFKEIYIHIKHAVNILCSRYKIAVKYNIKIE